MGELAARLKAIRDAKKVTEEKEKKSVHPPPAGLYGFRQTADFVYEKETFFEVPSFPFTVHSYFGDGGTYLFFDTETTGLSGGAGTVVFLAGFGFYQNGKFKVKQYFLSDYPGEPEFLKKIKAELETDCTLVSYNGRAFDANLLRGRFVLNGLAFPEKPHRDLLYPARFFWRDELPDFSLGTVERSLLAVQREDDIPGSLVPEIYFRHLKNQYEPVMEKVITHNQTDIVSLYRFFLMLNEVLLKPLEAEGVNAVNLGRYILSAGRQTGEQLLQREFEKGSSKAAALLSLHYKKNKKWKEAETIWLTMLEAKSFFAAVELAKYYEHREKNYMKALEVLESVNPVLLNEEKKKELKKRRLRLEAGRRRSSF
jgi:hypothetical protein